MADLLKFFDSDHSSDVHSDTNSLFIHPEAHRYVMPFVEEFQLLSNIGATPSSFGTSYEFELFDNGDLVGDVYLKLVVPALGGGATNARVCDYAIFCIERVDFYHGGVLQSSKTPEEIFAFYMRYKTPEQIVAFQNMVAGNLSQAQRITNASGAQTFYFPLLPYWARSGNPSHFLPVRAIAKKNVTRVKIVFRPTTYFLQASSGTPTLSITSLHLLARYYHVTDPQRIALNALVGRGYDIKMIDTSQKILSEPLTSGSSEYSIKLNNLRSPISELYFIVRATSDLQTNHGNNPTNFVQIQSFSIEASGTNIIRADIIDETIDLYIINAEKYRGYVGTRIYGYSWAWVPQMDDSFMGSFDFASIVNPILKIKFPSALGANHLVDIYSTIPNLLRVSTDVVKKKWI